MKLGPPATPAQIATGERRAKMKFPRSYRTFLAMHNGWLGFWPDWSLLGVSGRITDEMRRDVRQSLQLAKDAIDNDAEMDDREPAEAWAALERDERRSPNVIHPLRHPVLGTDFNVGLLLFDRNRVGNGEPQVAAVRNGHLEQRWRSFEHLLAAARDDLRTAGPKSEAAPRKPSPATRRASAHKTATATPTARTVVSIPKAAGTQAAWRLVSASADGTLIVWDPVKATRSKGTPARSTGSSASAALQAAAWWHRGATTELSGSGIPAPARPSLRSSKRNGGCEVWPSTRRSSC
jgi:hypothetical protein